MAKIKHTKNELKAQREALARFERFLPMLQLKKQQLQVEVQTIAARIGELQRERAEAMAASKTWIALFSELGDLGERMGACRASVSEGNIAGVAIPVLDDVRLEKPVPDLFQTPPWLDDGLELAERLVTLRVQQAFLEEQRRRVAEELRTTSQRVNLFEKVKIPECRENIRVIRIFLGDEQTAAVARAKLAKDRSSSRADERARPERALTS